MNDTLTTFYRDKTVLVTGHTGFKGGWLVSWLREMGAEVVGYALEPHTEPNLFEAAGIADKVRSVFGDVRDLPALKATVTEHQPDLVFHLAAQAIVRRSYQEPVVTYATNVMGTAHLLESVRHCPSVESVVVVTSDKCYENQDREEALQEDAPMGGYDPYSSSKGCAELVTSAYRRSYFQSSGTPAVATARAGNVIGGGDWSEDRLVPDFYRAAASDTPIHLRSPQAVRPWQYVLEPLRGYLMLGQHLFTDGSSFAKAWNFGPRPGSAITVRALAERIVDRWDKVEYTTGEDEHEGPYEVSYLELDATKAQQRLEWVPLLTIDETLDRTVSWYRSFFDDPSSASRLLRTQIQEYSKRMQAAHSSSSPSPA